MELTRDRKNKGWFKNSDWDVWLRGVDMLVGLFGSYDIQFREEPKHMLWSGGSRGGLQLLHKFQRGKKFCAVFRRGSLFFRRIFSILFSLITMHIKHIYFLVIGWGSKILHNFWMGSKICTRKNRKSSDPQHMFLTRPLSQKQHPNSQEDHSYSKKTYQYLGYLGGQIFCTKIC